MFPAGFGNPRELFGMLGSSRAARFGLANPNPAAGFGNPAGADKKQGKTAALNFCTPETKTPPALLSKTKTPVILPSFFKQEKTAGSRWLIQINPEHIPLPDHHCPSSMIRHL